MGGPLEGIKVVEMGVWVAGPAAGVVIADWGADVVKIEPPGIGDQSSSTEHHKILLNPFTEIMIVPNNHNPVTPGA